VNKITAKEISSESGQIDSFRWITNNRGDQTNNVTQASSSSSLNIPIANILPNVSIYRLNSTHDGSPVTLVLPATSTILSSAAPFFPGGTWNVGQSYKICFVYSNSTGTFATRLCTINRADTSTVIRGSTSGILSSIVQGSLFLEFVKISDTTLGVNFY
jgi:hypothetical protein